MELRSRRGEGNRVGGPFLPQAPSFGAAAPFGGSAKEISMILIPRPIIVDGFDPRITANHNQTLIRR